MLTRNKSIDKMKGIAILLMVAAHAGIFCTHFIYLFHMAVFFAVSGYLWSNKYINIGFTKFLKKKLKSLWVPFIACNGAFVLLNNLLVRIGIYSNDPRWLTVGKSDYVSLNDTFSAMDTIKELIMVLLFRRETGLGGATWFFRTLFLVEITHYFVDKITHKVMDRRVAVCVSAVGVCFIIVIAQWISSYAITWKFGLHTVPAAYLAFIIGRIFKMINIEEKVQNCKGRVFYVLAVFNLICLFSFNGVMSVGLGAGYITNVLLYVIVSVNGIVLLYAVSWLLKGRVARIFEMLGKNTIWICTLHFFAFKIIIYIYILVNGLDSIYLASFPVLPDTMSMPYIMAGVFFPIMVAVLYQKGKEKLSCKLFG